MVVAAIVDVLPLAAPHAQRRQEVDRTGCGLRRLPQRVPLCRIKRRQQPGERVGLGRYKRRAERHIRRFGKGGKRRKIARKDGFVRVFIGKNIAVFTAKRAAVLVFAEGKFKIAAKFQERRAVRQAVEKVSVGVAPRKARRRAVVIRQLCRGGRKEGKQHHKERRRPRERNKQAVQTIFHAAPQ